MLALQFSSALERISEVPQTFLAYLLSDKSFAECQNLYYSFLRKMPHVETAKDSDYISQKLTDGLKSNPDAQFSGELNNHRFGSLSAVICKGLVFNVDHREKPRKLVNICDLKVKWQHDLEKCVDASPTLLIFR